MSEERIVHLSPYKEWFADQGGLRGVWLCNKANAEKVKVEPPAEWGRHWAWNITEDGLGIYLRRTLQ
jgi:hypothetical protein